MSEKSVYVPRPIETQNVELAPEILALAERLAENAHDVWALGRLRDGWRYGSTRNDDRKEHPDLVAYSELSEAEKEYDRRTALETLKAIVALGFDVTPPQKQRCDKDS